MKQLRLCIMAVSMVGLLATAACGDTVPDDTDDTVGDVPTTQAEPTVTTEGTEPTGTTDAGTTDAENDPAALAARLQSELVTLSEEIQDSEGAEELQEAWTEVEAAISSALAGMDEEGSFDAGDLEDQLDEFQSALDSMGEDVGSEVREAWTSLRSTIEELMS